MRYHLERWRLVTSEVCCSLGIKAIMRTQMHMTRWSYILIPWEFDVGASTQPLENQQKIIGF